jgi:transcriptional regulator with XRE-family HTH domain
MFKTFEKLPNGFGDRLKLERKRLGMNQEEFGAKAGVQRFTQYQYEAEVNSPTVRYLASILEIGVDLTYVLFGIKVDQMSLSQSDMQAAERKAFELIEQNEANLGEKLTPEKRYVMFDLIRAHLVQSKLNELHSPKQGKESA